jgi:hypothetical protein
LQTHLWKILRTHLICFICYLYFLVFNPKNTRNKKNNLNQNMKRACSLNTNKDEYLTCEFHPTIKKQIIFG